MTEERLKEIEDVLADSWDDWEIYLVEVPHDSSYYLMQIDEFKELIAAWRELHA